MGTILRFGAFPALVERAIIMRMTIHRAVAIAVLFLLLTPPSDGQSIEANANSDEVSIKKSLLLSDLHALEIESAKLEKPLALALAKAEIANAIWSLDQTRAKKLLHDAYELTFPEESERTQLQKKPIGAPLTIPTKIDTARNTVRGRVLEIAGRDSTFADELARLGAQQLGVGEEHLTYASLAAKSLADGQTDTASKYILKAIEADPTLINAGLNILTIAAQDRAAADKLIIQYIDQLRTLPLPMTDDSFMRIHFILRRLVFTDNNGFKGFGIEAPQVPIPPASPAVVKAYLTYVIESVGKQEQIELGSAQRFRGLLLSVWLPIKQYTPELIGAFLELERLSRRPGEDGALPQVSSAEASRSSYEKRVKDALDSDQPDELTINFAISHEDFTRARKLIDKLPDGLQKAQLTDLVNMKQALNLAAKGDLPNAQRLAEQLTRAASMQQVYPVLISKCGTNKDQACASALAYQAMKQLKHADTAPSLPPSGIRVSGFLTSRELDPVLLSLSKLAKAVLPINESLAFEVLDEAVRTANVSEMDTGQGRTGFDADLFKQFAAKNDARTRQAAETFKDPLRRIVALAAIYEQQAMQLMKQTKIKP